MRLPIETFRRLALALTASLALSGCGMFGGGYDDLAELQPAPPAASGAMQAAVAQRAGPAGDYPVVVGDAYSVGNTTYTPADTLNYDEVGYVVAEAGTGVTAAHHTLPLPSYVEVTSLDSGKTILVRVERRGPMTSDALIALSPMALNQLGGNAGTPVRVRRVNPQEEERAKLRMGQSAAERMDTPMSLVAVLKRKLPAASPSQFAPALAQAAPQPLTRTEVRPSTVARELPAVAAAQAPQPRYHQPAARTLPRPALPPLGMPQQSSSQQQRQYRQPVVVATMPQPQPQRPDPRYAPTPYPQQQAYSPAPQPAYASVRAPEPLQPTYRSPPETADGAFVVQVAALSSLEQAQRVAGAIGGRITQAGSFYRVRTGPFTTRGQAEASLAKVHAAGYSEARIFTNG